MRILVDPKAVVTYLIHTSQDKGSIENRIRRLGNFSIKRQTFI